MADTQHNLEIVIAARIEQLRGKEQLEQSLADSAQKISTIGQEASQSGVTGLFDAFSGRTITAEDQKSFDKMERALAAFGKTTDEKGQELLQNFLQEKEVGLTRSQEKSWQRKFNKLADEASSEYTQLYQDVLRPEIANLPETEQQRAMQSLEDMKKKVVDAYRAIGEQIRTTKDEQQTFFEQLQKAGYFTAAGIVVNQGLRTMIAGAQIEARERTAFDLSSPIGMYAEREQAELFKATTQRSIIAETLGTLLGGVAGFYLGGGIGVAAGAAVGRGIGDQVAELFNIPQTAETQERIKLLQQTYQTASSMAEEFRPYDIEATRASGRFGRNLRGSMGIGYTPQQELQYKETYGESARRFEEEFYDAQLVFSRTNYLDPSDVMRLNRYSRFTGQNYGTRELMGGRDVAQSIFGEDADKKRVVDLLESIANINLEMLKVSANADTREAMKFGAIPEALFGINNPYGRLGDYGAQTIQQFASLGTVNSEAKEAFLYQAYMMGEEKPDINEWLARERGGIFYKDNLTRALKFAQMYAGGDEKTAKTLLYSLMPGAMPSVVEKTAGLISGEGIDIVTDYQKNKEGKYINERGNVVARMEDAAQIKRHIQGVEGLEQFQKEFEAKLKAEGKTDEQITEGFKQQMEKAASSASKFETVQEQVQQIHFKIAETWKDSVLNTQTKLAEIQETWLSSQKALSKTMDEVEKGFEYMRDKLKTLGLFPAESRERTPEGKYMQRRQGSGSIGGAVDPSEGDLNAAIIEEAHKKYGVDKNLINSVIQHESGGDAHAVSKKGAKGLMQLMDSTATAMGVKDVFDPYDNIMGGTKYLKQMLDKYEGDIAKALAAYNAGPKAVDKYGGIPPFPETTSYVKDVMHQTEFKSKSNVADNNIRAEHKQLSPNDFMDKVMDAVKTSVGIPVIHLHFNNISEQAKHELENSKVSSSVTTEKN